MTLSPETQRAERLTIVRGMLETIGDDPCHAWRFTVGEDFPDVHLSAWVDLEQDFIIDPRHTFGASSYQMSAHGWCAALVETGAAESERVRERCVNLLKVLKSRVDAATDVHGAFFDADELTPESGLPPGWVENVL